MRKIAITAAAVAIAAATPLQATAMPRGAAAQAHAPEITKVEMVRKPYGNAWQPQYSTEWRRMNGPVGWRGHPGRRHHHDRRVRRDRDWNDWIVPGIAGAIIGGAIANAPRYVPAPAPVYRGNWQAHVAWCDARYRTYRVADNSFIPRPGFRQQCVSPYS